MKFARHTFLFSLILVQACGEDPSSTHQPDMALDADMATVQDMDTPEVDQRPDTPDMPAEARSIVIEGLPTTVASAPGVASSYTVRASGVHDADTRTYTILDEECNFDVAVSSNGDVNWTCDRGGVTCEVKVGVSIAPDLADEGVLTIDCEADAPYFLSTPPTQAFERTPYTYPILCETTSTLPITHAIASNDTCGGTLTDGIYQWTPTETQGGTPCEVALSCSTSTGLTALQTTTVEVTETNETPSITNLPATTSTLWGREGNLIVEVTDDDLPVQPIDFSVDSHTCSFTPVIAAESGELTWTCGAQIETCEVTIKASDGELSASQQATISCENSAPTTSQVAIAPGTIYVLGATLVCDYVFSDPDMDEDRTEIEWLINGVTVASGQGFSTYLAEDVVTCRVTPSDGVSQGAPMTSAPLTAPDHAQVTTDASNACVLKDGGVWCWGQNNRGQLGDGTYDTRHIPQLVPGLEQNVTALVSAFDAVCAIQSGALYCWGASSRFRGSVASNVSQVNTPTLITGMESGVTHVALSQFMCAIKDGGAHCWGQNNQGQLGDGTTDNSNAPVAVLSLDSGVTDIAVAQDHACAIQHGALYCWGNNFSDQLGFTTAQSQVTSPEASPSLDEGIAHISISDTHSCAVKRQALYCWGENDDNQILSDDDPQHQSRLRQPLLIPGMDADIWDVNVQQQATCVIKNGEKWCWGDNSFLMLGEDPTSPRMNPLRMESLVGLDVQALSYSVSFSNNQGLGCAVQGQAISCWGKNDFGQVGQAYKDYKETTPQLVPGLALTSPTQIAGQYVLDAGAVYHWGFDVDPSIAVTGLETSVTALDYGGAHACAIKAGALYCWGDNSTGQLGLGANAMSDYDTPQLVPGMDSGVTAISNGGTHTCAIKTGELWCWGGQSALFSLGTATGADPLTPSPVTNMSSGVTEVAAGDRHTCATRLDTTYCWGSNREGQLGFRDNFTGGLSTPSDMVVGMETNMGKLYASVLSPYSDDGRSCAIKDNQLWCWGGQILGSFGINTMTRNYYLPVMIPLAMGPIQDLEVTENNTYLVHNGALQVAGNNLGGSFGDGTTTSSPVFITVPGFDTGVTHVDNLCLIQSGQVYCWGDNANGRIGVGVVQSEVALPVTFP